MTSLSRPSRRGGKLLGLVGLLLAFALPLAPLQAQQRATTPSAAARALVCPPAGSAPACIDWQNGLARASGEAVPASWAKSQAQKRLSAAQAARIVAQRQLLELIQGVRINAQSTVAQAMLQDDTIRTQVQGRLLGVRQIGDTEYLPSGIARVRIETRLNEVIPPQLVLTADQRTASTGASPAGTSSAAASSAAASLSGVPLAEWPETPRIPRGSGIEVGRAYSGLIVDARGLNLVPALAPRLIDPEGMEVYGAAYVSREFLLQDGMVGYAKSIETARQNPRIGASPALIRGRQAHGANPTDVSVSHEDAQALRHVGRRQSFLRQGRVIFVLD